MSTSLKLLIKKYGIFFIFCFVFVISLVIRFQVVSNYNIAFTSDQARDMLEVRHMAVSHTPKLIGPITDILGLYLGPFWYYYNLIPFIISGGNPLSLVYFSIIVFHLVSLLVFIFLSKKDKYLGLLASCLLLLSPVAFLTTRFSFNANAVFYFSSLFPIFIIFKSKLMSFLEGLLCGVVLQLQAAVGILFFPISYFLHLKRDINHRHLIPLSVGFFLTLIPQIAFEISHRFLMTKALFAEFFGNSHFLGSKLSFFEMISNRLMHFISLFSNVSYLPVYIIFVIIIFALLLPKKKSFVAQFLQSNLQFILIFLIFFLIFPYNLKDWYLYGLVPFAIYSFASSLKIISENHKAQIAAILIFCLIIFTSVVSNLNYLKTIKNISSNDPSNLKNMLLTVEKVYEDASGQSFKVYSYIPSVYDYTYQYIFWWYGTQKFGYQPSEISYLPDVPEYIKNNSTYWTKKKKSSPSSTFLIIQHDLAAPDRETAWRDKFEKASVEVINLPWNTSIEKINSFVKLRK